MKILDFIKALLPRLDKSNIIEDLRITEAELENIVIPNYKQATDHFKTNKFKSEANKEITNLFYRNFDLQGSSKLSSIIAEIDRRLPYIKNQLEYTLKRLSESLEEISVTEALTAKNAISIRAADNISFISRFSIDFLNYIYINEAIAANVSVEESIKLAPAVIKHIETNMSKFFTLVSAYSIPETKTLALMNKVPDVVLSSKNASNITGIFKESELDPYSSQLVAGFTGSPIYHIRLAIAEWQTSRYKANKDKKKMLELRLLHLKLLQEKKDDAKLEQEIIYLQSRIDKISRYLNEVETSLDDTE